VLGVELREPIEVGFSYRNRVSTGPIDRFCQDLKETALLTSCGQPRVAPQVREPVVSVRLPTLCNDYRLKQKLEGRARTGSDRRASRPPERRSLCQVPGPWR
jgi:hypothetical protein